MSLMIQGTIVPDDDAEIYDYYGITNVCPQKVTDAIEAENGGPLDVEIGTCYGGDVFSGSQMYAELKGYQGGIHIKITGLAASAASIIAMAGESEMAPTAQLMVHRASSFADGNTHDMDKAAARLKTADEAIAAAYVAKSGMQLSDALKMMDAETWLTAEQAVEKGLVDKVMFADNAITAGQFIANFGNQILPPEVIEKTRDILHPPESPEPNSAESKNLDTIKAELAIAAARVPLQFAV